MELSFFNVTLAIASVLVVSYLLWEFVFNRYTKTKKGKIIRIFLFEKIGKEFIFERMTTAEQKTDNVLGLYFESRKPFSIAIDRLSNDDFMLDKKYGKSLILVKYSEDDYRPLVRLRNQEFFKWGLVERQATDEDGKGVVDEFGNPVMETVKIPKPYEEPLGISQGDREAFRFNLKYNKRMQDKFGEQKSVWEKLAIPISAVLMGIILLMAFSYMTNKNAETQKFIAGTFGDKADGFIKATQEPTFIESYLNKYEQNKANDGAPPK